MAEIRGRFVFPDGLTPGRSKDGGLSQLLYDGRGNLADHGTFIPDDEDDGGYRFQPEEAESLTPEELGQAIAAVIGVALVAVAATIQAAPRVRRWWRESLLPRLRHPFTKARDHAPPSTELVVAATAVAPEDFAATVDVVLEDARTGMGSAEAQRRLAAVLAASAFIAEQVRLLSGARLDDDAEVPELEDAMEKLSAQQVTDSINRMLEANSSLLDEQASTMLLRMFGGGATVDGEYVPLHNTRVRDALRLTDGRADPPEDEPGAFAPA